MINIMPEWGPYSKKYFGISKITAHECEKGVRFDLTVLPCVANTDAKAPNVTVPVGVHPWECSSDYSYYSYRQDLEWKDVIYSDVSFTRLDSDCVLVRTEIFNNSDMMQNCLVNFFSAVQFPTANRAELSLPEKCELIRALDYKEFNYNTPRPWDMETMDAMHKGEFFDDRFFEHTGLGDRDGNRYILPKYPKLGEEKGDRILYEVDIKEDYSDAVLAVRYATPTVKESSFTVNGKPLKLRACDGLEFAFLPLGKLDKGLASFEFISTGGGAVEFDFFAITEKDSADGIKVKTVKNNYMPEISAEDFENGKLVKLKYEGIDDIFSLRTFNPDTRLRDIPTGCLEDVPTPRISQPDPSFDNMLETFSGEFSFKHSDDGYYQNTLVHTLYIKPGESHTEYAVISSGEVQYKTESEYEKIYLEAKKSAQKIRLNGAGERYEFSNNLLLAAVFQNTVYPLYRHGDYVVHHTPGKRWDSFYTWDSGFIGLGMNIFNPEIAEYILDLYLSDRDNRDYAFLLHGSPVPVHIYQYFDMLCRTNDKDKLYKYYDRVKMFYDFLAGKINGSVTAKFKSGMTTTFDYFYNCSGMDDLPPQAETYKRGLQLLTAPCISSSQVIRTAKLLCAVARHIGRQDDVAEYEKDIKRISDGLQAYSWDDEAGYFSYVIHDENGEPKQRLVSESGENLNKTIDGIYPLIAGITNENQTKKILSHLKSEEEMMSKVGISAVNMQADYFSVNGYWNGNVWFAHQWFIWKTMLDLGESDFAYKIAKTALEAWKREVEYSYYTFEMLSIVTGRGGWFHNFGGLSVPVNLWACAYYKPGSLTCGFDTFCEYSGFNGDNTYLRAEFSRYSDKKSTVLAVMNDKGSYSVKLNGEDAEFIQREKGTLEISIPETAKEFEIEIQLV